MATVTHTIYSYYDPKDHEQLQLDEKAEAEVSWQTEPPRHTRNSTAPPRFVPATQTYDPWNIAQANSSRQTVETLNDSQQNEVINWYRSLRETLGSNERTLAGGMPRPSSAPSTTFIPRSSSSSSSMTAPVLTRTETRQEKRDKNNWFIMNAMNTFRIQASNSTSDSGGNATGTTPPTLADILARDPPPKAHEEPYVPPVWLGIGPGNRGFAMLRRSGWSEGEALGVDAVRRSRKGGDMQEDLGGQGKGKGKAKQRARMWYEEQRVASPTTATAVQHRGQRNTDVIDLTISDSSDDDDAKDEEVTSHPSSTSFSSTPEPVGTEQTNNPTYGRKALLTPLATVLKSDRLGIGLKAKTVGPYKASQKRVTHNAAALAAHIRSAEETRRRKQLLGSGRKGFERESKKDALKRQMMLAYMNS
ncbi:hypothetical protein AMATHDRAFT_136334 [Amanita thiersii Skay4041]|uniref:G-patch domain-containing protein n=1 Tax=Amanita thiersii Skay4041 TaxID=703135 RepID=A0A2A9P0X4_9AGAR|nr:hypothetical protein AMATHDRAFT_136334 [Amanita thiersii Skay4041]